ncbi:unnamed protein product [Lymnaea stagnalis]|uniref:Ubiquitin-like domain-containing protein n=1 Tax=Lymnaea stagnalis TaxID=6523 RepID=A0AAV2HJW5_LYMST
MELPGDMPVTLTIKAPNQRMEDQTVDCMLGWTIKKLKKHLETVYPSKPKHNEQRLIYSGRLLQDHLTLKEILRQYDGSELPSNNHTVHLVCSSSSDLSNSNTPSSQSSSDKVQAQATPSSSTALNRPVTAPTNSQGEGLRYRGSSHTAGATSGSESTYTMTQPNVSAGDTYPEYSLTPEQYAWMMQQQMYSQYMMQYMQYYQTLYYSMNPQLSNSPFVQQPVNLGATFQQPQPQAAAPINNGVAGPNARPNVRMNAQGGIEEEDEDDEEPRDWLHHSYFVMRFLTFMGILFFYSNLTRFLIVFSGSLAIFILQKFRKYMQRAQREQEQQRPTQLEPNQQQQPNQQQAQNIPPPSPPEAQVEQNQERDNAAAEENAETPPTETGNSDQQQQAPEQPQDEGSRLTRACIFFCNTVQTFFTSLLPTPPELLEAN